MRQVSCWVLLAILTQSVAPVFVEAAPFEAEPQATEQAAKQTKGGGAGTLAQDLPASALLDAYGWEVKLKLLGISVPISATQVLSAEVENISGNADEGAASPVFKFYPILETVSVCAVAVLEGTATMGRGNVGDTLAMKFDYYDTANFSGTYECDVAVDGVTTIYSGTLEQEAGVTEGHISEAICDNDNTCIYSCRVRFRADSGSQLTVYEKVLFSIIYNVAPATIDHIPGYHRYSGYWMPCDYTLAPERTQAPDDACLQNGAGAQAVAGDPVNTYSGNFSRQEVDFSLPTRGLPLAFERSYNAQDTASGPLGQGWTHAYNTHLVIESDKVTLVSPRGSRIPFLNDGGTFVSLPGVRAQLAFDGGVYTLTQGDDIAYTFDSGGRLLAVDDGHGNATTMTYSGDDLTQVSAPDGRALTLAYSGGLLSSLTDPLGRSVQYGYDGNGRLVSVTDARGQVWTYAYDTLGRMTSFGDPLGNIVSNVYDGAGRVTAQTNALGETTTFFYNRRRTTITDAAGRVSTHNYDLRGALSYVVDPLGRVTRYMRDQNFNLTGLTDPFGRTTRYAWDGSGCSYTQVTDAANQSTHFAYDDDHNLTAITDPLNRTTHFGYDGDGNLTTLTNTLGYTASFGYDAYGQMTSSSDALGRTTHYSYDPNGNLTLVRDPLGSTTSLSYDAAGRVITLTNALNHPTAFSYDAGDNLVQVVDALAGVSDFSYDEAGRLDAVSDPLGHAASLDYDAAGRLITVTDALGGRTILGYDVQDIATQSRITSVRDANGHSTRFGYDVAGQLTGVTDPLDGQMVLSYDDAGNLAQARDALGRTTLFQYDALNRTVGITDALGNATWYGYDTVGNLVAEWQPGLAMVQYGYDALDRPESVTLSGLGEVLHYSYDAVGNLAGMHDGDGNSSGYVYDPLNRLSQIQDPLGNISSYNYDALGNLIEATDARGEVTSYIYDALNRLTGVVDPLGGQTSYRYDAAGNLTTATDANGHADRYTYDALNRLLSASDPLSHTTAYGYDAVGNTTVISDADGGVTGVLYDPLNRPTRVDYPAMGDIAGFSVEYAYDAVSNRTAMTDTTGTTSYSYDALNRPVAIDAPVTGRVRYAYSAAGRRTQTVYPAGETVTYTYDTLGRLESVADWDGGVTSYAYDNTGAVIQAARPNGVVTTYDYDDAGQLTDIEHRSEERVLGSYDYGYDGAGNRVAVTEKLWVVNGATAATTAAASSDGLAPENASEEDAGTRVVTAPQAEVTIFMPLVMSNYDRYRPTHANQYTYDAAGRLISATYGSGETFAYAYDAVGNRTAMTDTAGTTTYAYDDADRLAGDSQYDNRGNLLYDGEWTYKYDGAGLMVQAARAGTGIVAVDYTYNGDGLMVSERVDSVETTFTWDQALGLPQMLAASNGERYLYGYERIGTEAAGGTWSYPLSDVLGSVRQRTDGLGNATSNAVYDPFGSLIRQQGAGGSFGFTGEWSGASGLQYLRARWYDPQAGRFTQVDPFAGLLSLPGTQHPYTYGLNNPLRYVDPSGESVALLVGAAIAYSVGYLIYDTLVPDVAQGLTGWHILGYLMGYENIRQDIATMRNPCAKWWRKGLAAVDAVWNAALGISMVHGVANGLMHTLSLAKNLLKAGPASHSMLTLGNITLQESATVANPFRVPGTTNILVPTGYLGGNKWRTAGALAHEIAHIQQEFGVLGGIFRPMQGVSVATTRGAKWLWPLGYLLNPVEIHAAASGVTNWVNLVFVTAIKPFWSGLINGWINEYNFLERILGDE